MWRAIDESGELVYADFVETVLQLMPMYWLRVGGGVLYLVGTLLGVYNCHSQMIRPILSETKRYGEYSKPGEFVYDHPFQWGSRRIGPDLAREGGKQSPAWHALHFEDPAQVTQGSIMPPYPHVACELEEKTMKPRKARTTRKMEEVGSREAWSSPIAKIIIPIRVAFGLL